MSEYSTHKITREELDSFISGSENKINRILSMVSNIISSIRNSKKVYLFFKIVPLIALLAAFLFKAIHFEILFGNLTESNGDFFFMIVKHDLFFMGVLLALYYFSSFRKGILRLSLRFIILTLIVLYLVDIYIFMSFNSRLLLEDIVRYSSDVTLFFSNIGNLFSVGTIIFLIVATFLTSILFSIFFTYSSKIHQKRYIVPVAMLLMFSSLIGSDSHDEYNWTYRNMFEINVARGRNRAFSDDFKNNYRKKSYATLTGAVCKENNNPEKKNVIMLVVESYSMYHSKYFSGLNNYTPYMDKLAKENISFTNFYANSFKTEGGLIALLMGLSPIPVVNQYYIKGEGFRSTLHFKDNALPKKLNKLGYQTEFLTTGNLNFAEKDYWLDQIGFDYKEGSEHPYYTNWKRYKFDAAEDKALYNRAKSRIEKQKEPYFMVIENVSTHYPFINPEDDIQSEEGVFKYADKEIYKFYQHLKKINYFDNGILIIVSDHRATTEVTKDETMLYEEGAVSRIPMIIIDGKTQNKIEKRYQQLDLPNSIMNLVSSKSCVSDFQGDVFNKVAPKYILHSRYDNKDIVNLFTQKKDYRIDLNGDQTTFLNKSTPKEIDKVVERINYERIVRVESE